MSAVSDLFPTNINAVVDAPLQQGLTECFGPIRVGALANREISVVLTEAHVLIEARHSRIRLGVSGNNRVSVEAIDNSLQVLGCRATTPADNLQAELVDKLFVPGGELRRGKRVARAIRAQHRQSRVWHHHDRNARLRTQLAKVLAHLLWTRRAVEPDHVDAEWLESGERCCNFRTEQHRAGCLHRHFDKEGKANTCVHHRLFAGVDCSLRLQDILRRFDEKCVDPACEEAPSLLGEGVFQVAVGGVAERGEFGPRPHRPQDPAHPTVFGLVSFGAFPRDASACCCELFDAVVDAVIGEVGPVRAEGIRLDAVHADRKVAVVNAANEVRPRDVQNLVAALESLVVLQGGAEVLELGAHCTIGDDDPGSRFLDERVGAGGEWKVSVVDHGRTPAFLKTSSTWRCWLKA